LLVLDRGCGGDAKRLGALLSTVVLAGLLLVWRSPRPRYHSYGEQVSDVENQAQRQTSPGALWDPAAGLSASQAGVVVDVVSVSVKPTCVTLRAVAALNKHLGPRSIHVVTGAEEQCSVFRRHGGNVECWLENALLPGVSKDTVARYLERRFGLQGNGEVEFNGRHLAGWYLQQLLKLGAAEAIPGLSEYFVVWDLDMLLLRPMKLFQPDPLDGHLRLRVNIGGAHSRGYDSSYSNLFGRRLETASDGSSFVTHWMLVHKPMMVEFLADVLKHGELSEEGVATATAALPLAWAWRILESVQEEHLMQGFSEYASFVSWVRQRYPSVQAVATRRDWLRHPLGGRAVIQLLRHTSASGLCCPNAVHIWLTVLLGYQYTGFEIGHTEGCGYTDPMHSVDYGLTT